MTRLCFTRCRPPTALITWRRPSRWTPECITQRWLPSTIIRRASRMSGQRTLTTPWTAETLFSKPARQANWQRGRKEEERKKGKRTGWQQQKPFIYSRNSSDKKTRQPPDRPTERQGSRESALFLYFCMWTTKQRDSEAEGCRSVGERGWLK